MVQNAPVFADALAQFLSWCHSIRDDIQIYQWSDSDYEQLTKELALKQLSLDEEDFALLQKFQDFQKEYGETLGLSKISSMILLPFEVTLAFILLPDIVPGHAFSLN